MKNRILLFALFALFSLTSTVLAQGKFVIRGRISSSEDKQPIMGANVIEIDESERFVNGTITDFNGNFTFEVSSAQAKIRLSFIGYKSQDILVNNQAIINVVLSPDVQTIQEVTIQASVIDRDNPLRPVPRRDMTGSSSKVDMAEMEELGVSSADEALQGQVSGVDIVMDSGDPGSGSTIVIRGMGSLGASKPLIVIDGIPQPITVDDDFDFAGADQEDIGQLASIPPSNIASIEVLKDAAETAPYGSKGADGVILITTKKGTRGKPVFRYNYKFSGYKEPASIPMLNGDEYVMLQLEENFAPNGSSENIPEEIAFDPSYVDYYNYSQNTNWIDAITDSSPFAHDHSFEVSGGGDKTTYYSSVTYLNQAGSTRNTDFKRLGSLVKLNYRVSQKLQFNAKFNYTRSDRGGSPNIKDGNKVINVRDRAYTKSPNMSIWEYDSSGNLTGEYFNPVMNYQGDGYLYFNPVSLIDLSSVDDVSNSISSDFDFRYSINNHLKWIETISYSYNQNASLNFLPYNAIGSEWTNTKNNSATKSAGSSANIYTRSQLQYNNVFNDIHVVYLGATWIVTQNTSNSGYFATSNSPSTSLISTASNSVITDLKSGYEEGRSLGGLLNGTYVINDKYIFSGSTRLDASSQFGKDKRWGIFPSASAAWRMSNENFMKGLSFVEDFKWRFSYGISGKEPGTNYGRFATYGTPSPSQYINNRIVTPNGMQLLNLRWQKVTMYNFGADISLLEKGKFNFSFDLYDKLTTDLLHKDYAIPSTTGYSKLIKYNGGSLRNRGYDIELSYTIIDTKPWRLSFSANNSQNVNSYESLPDNFSTVKEPDIKAGKFPLKVVIGEPVGSFYGLKYLGVYATKADIVALDADGKQLYDLAGKPLNLTYSAGGSEGKFKAGDAIYADLNHDGQIDNYDVTNIGNSNPDFMGGLNTNLSYKNFKFSVGLYSRIGQDIVNQTALNTQNMSGRDNQSKAVLHRWRKSGDGESYFVLPRAYYGNAYNWIGSDRFVEDGSYLRLNSVSLKYDLSKEFASRLGLKSASVSVNVRRIYTWTGYSGQDPEVGLSADPFWMSVDDARTPPSKQVTFNLNLSF